MSDYDNLREDEYERKLEASNEARDVEIEFHIDNWMVAVTKSVEKSNGTFDDVTDYDSKLTSKGFAKRKANSVDVFIETLHDDRFMERAAEILINLQGDGRDGIDQLFEDMARSYAEFQYEKIQRIDMQDTPQEAAIGDKAAMELLVSEKALQVKHTPAPWKTYKTPNDPDFTHEISGVCPVYVGENSEANARLIAAAPELLDALYDMVESYQYEASSENPALLKAKSVIAKATGEKA